MRPPLACETHERLVLGCVLVDPSAMVLLRGLLTEDHFTTTAAKCAWKTYCRLYDGGQAITVHGLIEALDRDDVSDSWSYAAGLDTDLPDVGRVETYADVLDERLARRKLHEGGKWMSREALREKGDARLVISRALERLHALESRSHGPGGADLKAAATALWTACLNPPEARPGVSTGWASLDQRLLIHRGQLGLVVGRTSQGKSVVGQQIALYNAQLGRKVALRSLEMSRDELVLRAVAQLQHVPLQTLVQAWQGREPWTEAMKPVIQAGFEKLGDLPYMIEDMGKSDRAAILGWASRMHALAGPLDLLVVDYLQLIGGPEESDYARVTAAGRALKEWAKAKQVPVILLSQVTDAEPGRMPEAPSLGQTRWSRDVEMDADWELAVHRPAAYSKKEDENLASFRLLKQRNGWTGELEMGWDGPATRFYDRH